MAELFEVLEYGYADAIAIGCDSEPVRGIRATFEPATGGTLILFINESGFRVTSRPARVDVTQHSVEAVGEAMRGLRVDPTASAVYVPIANTCVVSVDGVAVFGLSRLVHWGIAKHVVQLLGPPRSGCGRDVSAAKTRAGDAGAAGACHVPDATKAAARALATHRALHAAYAASDKVLVAARVEEKAAAALATATARSDAARAELDGAMRDLHL